MDIEKGQGKTWNILSNGKPIAQTTDHRLAVELTKERGKGMSKDWTVIFGEKGNEIGHILGKYDQEEAEKVGREALRSAKHPEDHWCILRAEWGGKISLLP